MPFTNLESIPKSVLQQCEVLPIEAPGQIQECGYLIAFHPLEWIAEYASENLDVEEIIGCHLFDLLPELQESEVLKYLLELTPGTSIPLHLPSSKISEIDSKSSIIHRSDTHYVLEVSKEVRSQVKEPAQIDLELSYIYNELQNANSAKDYLARIVKAVSVITGYDRVMAYQLDSELDGTVIAESRSRHDIDSYLNLSFPAGDLSKPVRDLFKINRVTMLSDSDGQQVSLYPPCDSKSDSPLSLTFSCFRTQHETCRMFYRNMGVRSTLVASLIVDNDLWGLISCHHHTVKPVDLRQVRFLRHLSEIASGGVEVLRQREQLRSSDRASRHSIELFGKVETADSLEDLLFAQPDKLMEMIPSDGISLISKGSVRSFGICPDIPMVSRFIDRLAHDTENSLQSIVSLKSAGYGDIDWPHTISGALAVALARDNGTWLCWWRKEKAATRNWAGEPGKIMQEEDEEIILLPRNSFESWKEDVKGICEKWEDEDLVSAKTVSALARSVVTEYFELRSILLERDLVRVYEAFDWATCGIAILDQEQNIRHTNQKWEEVFGQTTLQGKITEFAAQMGLEKEELFSRLNEAAKSGVSYSSRVKLGEGDDLRYFNLGYAFLQQAEDLERSGYVLIATDVTAVVEHENAVNQINQQVAKAKKVESLQIMAGGIAHDFNNLLVGILGAADLLLTELPQNSTYRHSVETIVDSSQRAADLTKQMLAYSGRGKFLVETANLSVIVQEMEVLLKSIVGKKINLLMDLDIHLPSILVDVTQLRQVIMNLVINSREAIGEDEGEIIIEARKKYIGTEEIAALEPDQSVKVDEYICMTIRDTGGGMNKETREFIFDPFYSSKGTGRGLGLAAVMGIVQSHNAFIDVKTRDGESTAVTIGFPIASEGPLREASERNVDHESDSEKKHVLIVDDEEVVRKVTTKLFDRLGYKTTVVKNGNAALERIVENREQFDLILLDKSMPNLSGKETLKGLVDSGCDIPVILMSGYSEEEIEKDAEGASIVKGFLAKPFTIDQLKKIVESVEEK